MTMGTSCGTRVFGLVALVALASAATPVFARADITGSAVPAVVPAAAPAVPAAPAASAPIVPVVGAVAAGAAAAVSAASKTTGGTVSVDPGSAAVTIDVPTT